MHYVGYIIVGFIIFIGHSACKEIPLQNELDNISDSQPHSRTRRCEYNKKTFNKKIHKSYKQNNKKKKLLLVVKFQFILLK